MGLQLKFSDKYRLWTELIQSGVDRIFIESDQPFRLGSEVPVELVLPDLPLHIVMLGTVVGLRPASDRFGQGVYVRFSSGEIEKCRSYLGLSRVNDRVESGRRVSRIDCALALRFLVPSYNETFIVKNISERGLLAKRQNPHDSRSTLITVTPAGRRCIERLVDEVRAVNDLFFGHLSRPTFLQAKRFFGQLMDGSRQALAYIGSRESHPAARVSTRRARNGRAQAH